MQIYQFGFTVYYNKKLYVLGVRCSDIVRVAPIGAFLRHGRVVAVRVPVQRRGGAPPVAGSHRGRQGQGQQRRRHQGWKRRSAINYFILPFSKNSCTSRGYCLQSPDYKKIINFQITHHLWKPSSSTGAGPETTCTSYAAATITYLLELESKFTQYVLFLSFVYWWYVYLLVDCSSSMGTNVFRFSSGKFGLWLDGDLYLGRTQRCKTYGNEPLSTREDFIVKIMECWTFIWAARRHSPSPDSPHAPDAMRSTFLFSNQK